MTPDVQAFPRYNSEEDRTGYTLFNPGSMVDPKNPFISPGAVNVGFDSLLRKVFPNLPADPNYVKTHGMLDTANNIASGMSGTYTVDLGNLERGRPIVYNSSLMNGTDPHHIDKTDMLEQMLKHSSQEAESLKDKVKELIKGKKTSNMSKNSMLSEEFIKTIAKNKKNQKTAGLGGALFHGAAGLGGVSGVGTSLDQISKGREENSLTGTIGGVGSAASNIAALGDTARELSKVAPKVMGAINNNISPVSNYMGKITGGKALGRLGAIGAPFAIAETYKNLDDMQDNFHYGHTISGIGNGLQAAGNGAVAYSNIANGMNTYKGIAGAIARNAPGMLNSAKNIATNAGNAISEAAPGLLDSAESIAGRAAPAIAEVAPAGLSMGLKALPIVGDIAQGYMYGKANHSIGRGIAAGLGSFGGRLGGAAAGTVVAPGVGTAVGEIGGSVAGAYGGAKLYDAISGAGKPVQSNTDPVNPPAGNNMLNDPKYKSDLERYTKAGLGTANATLMAQRRYKSDQAEHQINPTGASGEHSGTLEQGKSVDTAAQNNSPKTPATDAALGKAPTPSPASSIGTADNNKVAPLPEQKPGIPSVGQPNSAPVSGAGNKAMPDFSGTNMLKESGDQITQDPTISSVKPMEHIPRPPESPDLIQNSQFAGESLKNENREHNFNVLVNHAENNHAHNLPPNPFIGRVTGVQQTTGGVTTYTKPGKNSIVTDQNEFLNQATSMHQSKVDELDLQHGGVDQGGYSVKPQDNGSTQLLGPDGKVHGTMQVNPAKPTQPLAKSGSLKRRNTGIGDWINPEDFKYLSKSASYIGLTPEEYIGLPMSEKPDTIINFFTPFG